MSRKTKTEEITNHIESVIDQTGGVINSLHSSIKKVNFRETLSENDIEMLRLHLGYTKNYSDLAKTRLMYSRTLDKADEVLELET